MTVIDIPTDAVEGTGEFTYSMSITVGGPGGTTDVVITPNHNFDEIAPRQAFQKSPLIGNFTGKEIDRIT